jgi:hypothetical protein
VKSVSELRRTEAQLTRAAPLTFGEETKMHRHGIRLPVVGVAVAGLLLTLLVGNYLGADEVVAPKQHSSITKKETPASSDEQPEIEGAMQVLRSIGSAWQGDAIILPSDSMPEAKMSDEEVVRTAMIAHARESDAMSKPFVEAVPTRGAALREAAHQLDLAAHSLECQELYEQADELRAVAQRFRLQAREKGVPELYSHEKG